EFEFRTPLGQDAVVILVALEMGKIKRIMFTVAEPDDPDMTRSLTDTQLENLLAEKGEQLIKFFDYITR
ncbi:MAG: hypothetical protein K6U74_17005, partial [Firmicutes bacterium]|nr:hypothetical protein [Bacillota bacterium]